MWWCVRFTPKGERCRYLKEMLYFSEKLWKDVRAMPPSPSHSLPLFSVGQPQWADQRCDQLSLHAALQGLHKAVCCLQWRGHQPIGYTHTHEHTRRINSELSLLHVSGMMRYICSLFFVCVMRVLTLTLLSSRCIKTLSPAHTHTCAHSRFWQAVM